jgi:hypothetical protein
MNTAQKIPFTNPDQAFDAAIAAGRLSADQSHVNWAGKYMYMGDDASGRHLFKNRITREYLA